MESLVRNHSTAAVLTLFAMVVGIFAEVVLGGVIAEAKHSPSLFWFIQAVVGATLSIAGFFYFKRNRNNNLAYIGLVVGQSLLLAIGCSFL